MIWDGRRKISELENQSIEIAQSEEQRNKRMKKTEDSQRLVGQTFQHRYNGIPRKRGIKEQKIYLNE